MPRRSTSARLFRVGVNGSLSRPVPRVAGRNGGIREELAAAMNDKTAPRAYLPRIVGEKVMMPPDLKRLHKYMLDVEHIGFISNEMCKVVEGLWPELAHKLPPKIRRD